MLTLGNLFLLMVVATIAAWLWHGHGLRERALALVTRHCARLELELLDGNVAFRRYAIVPDARGRRRFARLYDFEFTVTGEQRLSGHVVMFGRHVGRIELDPHPFPTPASEQSALPPVDNIVSLNEWRERRQNH